MRIFVIAGIAALAVAGILASGSLYAKVAPLVPQQARVFVDEAGGFDVYLTAAIERQHIQVTVTTDKARAQYEIGSTRDGKEAGVKLVDLKSGNVIFAYSLERKNTKAAADEFARRLGTIMQPRSSARKNLVKRMGWLADDPAFEF